MIPITLTLRMIVRKFKEINKNLAALAAGLIRSLVSTSALITLAREY
jgi:hypothetical protein